MKLVCPRYLCALLMGLLGEHQTLISCLQICCLDLNDLPILSLSVEDCLGRCASRLSEVTIVRLHFGTQMVTRKQWFLAAESELRLAKSAELRSVPRRYVSLSACSCMFISVKLVFTVCSNHAFDGEQQKQRVRVCVCVRLYINNACVCVCVCVCE